MTETATRKTLLILLITFFGNFIMNAQTTFEYSTYIYQWSVTTTETKVTLTDNELEVTGQLFTEYYTITKSEDNITLNYNNTPHTGQMLRVVSYNRLPIYVFISEGLFITFDKDQPTRNIIYLK